VSAQARCRLFIVALCLLSACSLETGAIGRATSSDVAPQSTEPSFVPEDAAHADAGVSSSSTPTKPTSSTSSAGGKPPDSSDAGQQHDASSPSVSADGGSLGAPQGITVSTDPWAPGSYPTTSVPGDGDLTVFAPSDLATSARKHPVVIWDNARGIYGTYAYRELLEHVASHGYIIVAAYASSPEGSEILAALDWILAENQRSGSPYFEKLDEKRVAAMGHAQGSVATFAVAADPCLTTTIHLSGATSELLGKGHALRDELRHPAAFLCDQAGGMSLPFGDASASCQDDFDSTTTPIFLATLESSEQLNLPLYARGAIVSWLRWQLDADATMKPTFVGSSCTLCSRAGWRVQQRGLATLP
jgi:hypothetical protein